MPTKIRRFGSLEVTYTYENSNSVEVTTTVDGDPKITTTMSPSQREFDIDLTDNGTQFTGKLRLEEGRARDRLTILVEWKGVENGDFNGVIGMIPKA